MKAMWVTLHQTVHVYHKLKISTASLSGVWQQLHSGVSNTWQTSTGPRPPTPVWRFWNKIWSSEHNNSSHRLKNKIKNKKFPLFDWHPPPSMGTDSKFCWFRAVKGKWTPRGRFIFRSGPAKIFKFAEWVPTVLSLYLFHVPFGIITRDWWFDSIPWPLDILCMRKFRCGPHTFVSLFTFSAQNFHYHVGFLRACLPKNKGIFFFYCS